MSNFILRNMWSVPIQKVIDRYHKLYPTKSTHKITKAQRIKRERQGLMVSPTLHEWQELMNTTFTVPFD